MNSGIVRVLGVLRFTPAGLLYGLREPPFAPARWAPPQLVLGLTRRLRDLAATASRRVPPTRMPQANKARNAAAGEAPGAAPAGAPAEDANPVTRQEGLAAGEDNVGDRGIIKSPSDPKQYR